MLRIRLRRVGKTKQPMYRIVVADSRSPRDGAFVEALGYYHPLENPSTIVLNDERARHWLDKGAQPSERVAKILAIHGIAEIPEKLKQRIALVQKRAAEEKAKPKPEAEAPAPDALAPAPEAAAPEAAPAAEAEPAAEAQSEAPAAEPAPEAEAPAAEEPAPEGEQTDA